MKMVNKMLYKSALIQYPFSHLIENDGVGYLVAEALRHRDVALGGVEVGRRRRPHDLGAERPQRVHLLRRHLLREHDDAAVALHRGRQGQADALLEKIQGGWMGQVVVDLGWVDMDFGHFPSSCTAPQTILLSFQQPKQNKAIISAKIDVNPT